MNREQTKYISTFLNNISIAIIIVGVLTPVLSNQPLNSLTYLNITISSIGGIILLVIGLIILRKIKDEPK